MTTSDVSANRRYRDRSSFTAASATSRLGFSFGAKPGLRLAFRDDDEVLDFFVGDVIEHPDVIHAQAELGPNQPAHSFDSTFGYLGRFEAKVRFQRIPYHRAVIGRQSPKRSDGLRRKDDLEAHL